MRVARFSKTEAARRQIDSAIRMLFAGYDPLAIHTLASAGFRILRDLAGSRATDMDQFITASLQPHSRVQFWRAMSALANYLKHADRDAEIMFDGFEEEFNDGILFIAALYYRELGNEPSIEMCAINAHFLGAHPELVNDSAPPDFRRLVQDLSSRHYPDRAAQLAAGQSLLELFSALQKAKSARP